MACIFNFTNPALIIMLTTDCKLKDWSISEINVAATVLIKSSNQLFHLICWLKLSLNNLINYD